MKKCNVCEVEKPYENFTKEKLAKDGYKNKCKECINRISKEKYALNPEARREYEAKWRTANIDKCKSKTYRWREKNPEQFSEYRKKYYNNNKEKIAEQSKATYEKHKEKYNSINRKYQKDNHIVLMQKRKKRIDASPLLQFKERIRQLVKNSFYRLKHNKNRRTSQILGADWEIVKKHFVSQFKDGMTWEAFIAGDIHVDHIQPLASAKTEEELIALCHYTNLQPLWCLDNLSKGATFEGVNYKTKQ
jgi:hypothetical protein